MPARLLMGTLPHACQRQGTLRTPQSVFGLLPAILVHASTEQPSQVVSSALAHFPLAVRDEDDQATVTRDPRLR